MRKSCTTLLNHTQETLTSSISEHRGCYGSQYVGREGRFGFSSIVNRTVYTWLASLSSTSSYSEILQSTTTLSASDKDQLPIQGIQHHGTSCLELSVSSYEKFRYHHHFQGTSENWTVLCCIRLSLTFLLPPAPPIRTLRHTAPHII